jgi:predicted nucleic acid-binding protein
MTSLRKSPLADRWVINASPVIALARVGQVDLLTLLPEQVVLPQAVAEELSRAPVDDPARQAVEGGMFKISKTLSPPPELLAWDLGKGETDVLPYALSHPGWIAILDDAAARRCARSFSIPLAGTLAIVVLAKKHGVIESAAQVLHALRSVDFRLEDNIIREVLARTIGEKWN